MKKPFHYQANTLMVKINEIINTISKENGLNTFSVESIETGKRQLTIFL